MMAKMNFSEARANDAQFGAKLELQMQQNFIKKSINYVEISAYIITIQH